jgi:hypothetical protein
MGKIEKLPRSEEDDDTRCALKQRVRARIVVDVVASNEAGGHLFFRGGHLTFQKSKLNLPIQGT